MYLPLILSLSRTSDRYRAVIRRGEGQVVVVWGGTPWRGPVSGMMGGREVVLTEDETRAVVEGEGRTGW
jgi:hypothetical protein